ncbi:non-heme chloroperoxidase [Granulicella rosea]|uniref:Non-heme chloroperoxidase n=1 Tax=Granulicella rosea TaxID=474952 RepID=A0A239DAA9_9BACT|nr:alpha/beta hydrolase [Granulicella rosea]SNS28623.1 non-heme chloroperoxidase [Granulicella rosea]
MPTIETKDGNTIFYKEQGTGAPVVLIHGWPLNADMWEKQELFLAENGYRVISYDRRGFGRSSKPLAGHDYDTLADDLAALLDTLDLTGVTLVGFSMGGGEVIRYLSRHGSARVVKGALISSSVPFMVQAGDNPDGVPPETFEDFKNEIRKDRFAFLDSFGPKFYGRTLVNHTVSQPVLNWTFALASQGSLKATLVGIDTFSSTDMRAELPVITTPFLIIHGTGDATVPAKIGGDVSARLLPNSTYIQYEGEPHGLFLTAADRLNLDLADFLSR